MIKYKIKVDDIIIIFFLFSIFMLFSIIYISLFGSRFLSFVLIHWTTGASFGSEALRRLCPAYRCSTADEAWVQLPPSVLFALQCTTLPWIFLQSLIWSFPFVHRLFSWPETPFALNRFAGATPWPASRPIDCTLHLSALLFPFCCGIFFVAG